MTVYCAKLQQLIADMQNDPAKLELFENDLQWLASWNHPDETVLLASALMSLMALELRSETEHPIIVLDIVRCALAALWPYIEEAPAENLEVLLDWYEIALPSSPSEQPDTSVVPASLCSQWAQAQCLRTLDGVRQLARLKGLWLVKNDIPYARRYQVMVPGSKSRTMMYYGEAADFIERTV